MKHIDTTKMIDIQTLKISSPAFDEGQLIPAKYTCDGMNVNPPIDIKNIPAETKSLALVVDDPDAPGQTWVHWLAWNIPVSNQIKENQQPGIEGLNDFHQLKYGGPCPPSGTHRYFFKVYALNTVLLLPVKSTKKQLEKVMNDHIIGYGELIGLYKRS